jgi:hypothetical protein
MLPGIEHKHQAAVSFFSAAFFICMRGLIYEKNQLLSMVNDKREFRKLELGHL